MSSDENHDPETNGEAFGPQESSSDVRRSSVQASLMLSFFSIMVSFFDPGVILGAILILAFFGLTEEVFKRFDPEYLTEGATSSIICGAILVACLAPFLPMPSENWRQNDIDKSSSYNREVDLPPPLYRPSNSMCSDMMALGNVVISSRIDGKSKSEAISAAGSVGVIVRPYLMEMIDVAFDTYIPPGNEEVVRRKFVNSVGSSCDRM
ncbi:hypothetical protein BFP70_14375 [Thioclava sp. SK-1]|uniref:hypothetical protein n=1 Tax=Thioclava sp. SK-1 TaxID=1889770 RepID=UPI000824970F|nr:hypothetical protein [Thioclava sp. SK-1]OCX62072.1 hypothetical protein BFP70_14375 [Thioclava sp. SK-1]